MLPPLYAFYITVFFHYYSSSDSDSSQPICKASNSHFQATPGKKMRVSTAVTLLGLLAAASAFEADLAGFYARFQAGKVRVAVVETRCRQYIGHSQIHIRYSLLITVHFPYILYLQLIFRSLQSKAKKSILDLGWDVNEYSHINLSFEK